MKNKIFLILFLAFCFSPCMADVPVIPSNTVPRVTSEPKPATINTNFENCVRAYNTSVDNLFYLTLAAINHNNYKLDEIQSRTGYISFEAGNKALLASITSVNNKISMIRITPADNSYAFSPVILEKIFNYLTNNVK